MKTVTSAYAAWLKGLGPTERAYIEERVLDKVKLAFVAGWNAGANWVVDGHTDPSKLHGSDPDHVCGVYCDGADGRSSRCAAEKRAGKAKRQSDYKVPSGRDTRFDDRD